MEEEQEIIKEPKLKLKETWKVVSHKHRGLMTAMVMLAMASGILLLFALIVTRPQNTVVIVGYGDVYGEIAGLSGGYRRSSWLNLLAFPLLAVVFGVVHNVIALRVYQKYGKEVAMALVVGTFLLIALVVVTMLRVIGEW